MLPIRCERSIPYLKIRNALQKSRFQYFILKITYNQYYILHVVGNKYIICQFGVNSEYNMVTTITDSVTLPQTIAWINKLIVEGSKSEKIHQLVLATKNYPNPVEAAFNMIWQNISYQPDPADKQNLKTVDKIFKDCTANCANYCILLGSYLTAIGQPFKIRVASYSKDQIPEHVYLVWKGIPLDLTAGQYYNDKCGDLNKIAPQYGKEFPSFTYRKDFNYSPVNNALQIMNVPRTEYFRKWYS